MGTARICWPWLLWSFWVAIKDNAALCQRQSYCGKTNLASRDIRGTWSNNLIYVGSNPVTHKFSELFAQQRNPNSSLSFLTIQSKKQGWNSLNDCLSPCFPVFSPILAPNSKKNLFCLGRQKRFLSCERVRKRSRNIGKRAQKYLILIKRSVCQLLFGCIPLW